MLTKNCAVLFPLEDETEIIWPNISRIGLTEQQRALRQFSLGGSDANIICSGDDARVLQLWEVKRGKRVDEDLSSKLAVMLGCWTEPFNRQWYERETGLDVQDAGAFFRCGMHAWRHATVDGVVDAKGAVWEAKHTSAFAKPGDVLARYMPQLQHNMAVAGLGSAILSVIYGNHRWEVYEVARDWLYQEQLLDAEKKVLGVYSIW